MIHHLWVRTAFARREKSALCVNACPVRKPKRVDSVLVIGFFLSGSALAQPGIGGSPEVRGSRCRRGKCAMRRAISRLKLMAAFRDIARTMEAVSTQFGGRGAAANLLARERPRTEPVGTWRGPSVDDLQPREGA